MGCGEPVNEITRLLTFTFPKGTTGDASLVVPDIFTQKKLDAYSFTGQLPVCTSIKQLQVVLDSLEPKRRLCHEFYVLLLSQYYPSPGYGHYVAFGFAACPTEEDEKRLAAAYQILIRRFSFDEFVEAFKTAQFGRLCLSIDSQDRLVKKVLKEVGSMMRPSAYSLKNYILSVVHDPLAVAPNISVSVDYGFMNCQNEADREALVKVYKLYFGNKGADPGELHKACIRGELSIYLRRFVSLVQDSKYF